MSTSTTPKADRSFTMFMNLDKAASMAELMSIVNRQKAVSAKLNGCSNYCVPGATAGVSVLRVHAHSVFTSHRVNL